VPVEVTNRSELQREFDMAMRRGDEGLVLWAGRQPFKVKPTYRFKAELLRKHPSKASFLARMLENVEEAEIGTTFWVTDTKGGAVGETRYVTCADISAGAKCGPTPLTPVMNNVV